MYWNYVTVHWAQCVHIYVQWIPLNFICEFSWIEQDFDSKVIICPSLWGDNIWAIKLFCFFAYFGIPERVHRNFDNFYSISAKYLGKTEKLKRDTNEIIETAKNRLDG